MFGLAWTEIALIGVVAMVLIGPKDLPVAVRAVADVVKKARRMAGEFQVHVDEMMRDSNLREMRDSLAEIRRMDITGDIRRAVDSDGSLQAALTDNPFQQSPIPGPGPASGPAPGSVASITEDAWTPPAHAGAGTVSLHAAAPSFIPPAEADAGAPADAARPVPAAPAVAMAPAFIPPEAARPSA